jgi:hypothetical protein
MDIKEPAPIDLEDDDLLEELNPALRAAVERVYAPEPLEGPGGFNSFVDADL